VEILTPVKARALACPNCGGPVEMRGFAHTLSVVCPSCHTILDASTPELSILQKVQIKQRIKTAIPLGTRGNFDSTTFEAIGYQFRHPPGEEQYGWSEYVLFNPYKGFRYLSEYQGHWSFIRTQTALPEHTRAGGKRAVSMMGRTYKHFDSATATTSHVLGEFPWRVKVGETVDVADYVAPPYMLSSEGTGNEITWSLGEYRTGAQIWQAFKLTDSPPVTSGVYMNEPSPFQGRVGSAWRLWLWLMIALFGLAILFSITAADKQVFEHHYSFTFGQAGEPSFVTEPFELSGRPSNAEVIIKTDLTNNWAYFNLALIDQDTGHAYDFGREVSYYYGSDSDGSWSEGSNHDSVTISGVTPGKYYLRVEPEMDGKNPETMNYEIIIRRGIPRYSWFWIAALMLLIPPIIISIRSGSFESTRWRESDYAPSGSSSGDD